MKKLLAAIATTATLLAAGSVAKAQMDLSELSINTTFAYESEYIFRGFNFADASFQPELTVALDEFYAGIWTNLPIDDVTGNEIDLFAGYEYDLAEAGLEGFAMDVGFTYYWFPQNGDFGPGGINRSKEVYVGVGYDNQDFFSPSVYVFYDFDLEGWTFELAGEREWDISEWGFVPVNSSISLEAAIGASSLDDLNSDQNVGEASDGWTYWSAKLNYNYAFTDNATMSTGIRYAGVNEDIEEDHHLWWGISFSAGF